MSEKDLSEGKPFPRLLCVDDDPSVLAAIMRLLSSDFEIVRAISAEEALQKLDQNPDVAIVLTDHRMNGMTGLDLLTKVQEKAPDAARVVFSGKIDLSEMAGAINSARIHRFIYKPWDNDYLRVQMLEALSIHTSLKERRALENMSVTDPLTQVKNRRYFQDRLQSEVERAVRHDRPLSLIMSDVDFFKRFNDEYGHQAGDLLLRSIAQTLSAQLRSTDTIARYGGEEFAIILPDTQKLDAMKVAERLRLALRKQGGSIEGGPNVEVTISLGVASVPDNASTVFSLIQAADTALYQAKRQGRNQSVGAS